MRKFLPITKVDAVNRLVYGVATAEAPDRSGEVCDYASSKPYYEKWSGEINKASGGKSFGNLRSMHGTTAAGKIEKITFNDGAKQIEIVAKVVDDAEWRKVEEGVYTGFSQGGAYVKRWQDEETKLQRYTAEPSEISLVDLPCLASATFQLVKAAGVEVATPFKSIVSAPTNEQVVEKATELAKVAGKPDWAEFIGDARTALEKAALPPLKDDKTETKDKTADDKGKEGDDKTKKDDADVKKLDDDAEPSQVWKANDGTTFAKKSEAVAHNVFLKSPTAKSALDKINDMGKRLRGKLGMEEEGDDALPAIVMKSAGLEKNLYSASRFASMLDELRDFQSCQQYRDYMENGENTQFASILSAWISKGCSILVAMVQDAADKMAPEGAEAVLAAAAGLKVGDIAHMRKIADVPALAKLNKVLEGHKPAGAAVEPEGDLAKLTKAVAELTADRDLHKGRGDGLEKALTENVLPMLEKISERVENIEKQPMPLPFLGKARVETKNGEDLPSDIKDQLEKLKKDDPNAFTDLLIKVAQGKPMSMHPAIG